MPADYAPLDFTTAALQHTNVKLTWDADDDTRKKALRKKMTEDTIREDDFKVSVPVTHSHTAPYSAAVNPRTHGQQRYSNIGDTQCGKMACLSQRCKQTLLHSHAWSTVSTAFEIWVTLPQPQYHLNDLQV